MTTEKFKKLYYKNNLIQPLRGFYYTANLGCPSLAAGKMGLSQAAIHQQLKSLEREFNIKLFHRSKNNFSLTKDGEILYNISIKLIHQIDNIFNDFSTKSNYIKNKTLNIGANHVSISYILPEIIKSFQKENPDILLKISNLDKDEGLERLLDGEIDLFLFPLDKIPSEFDSVNIAQYEPILLVNKCHPLARTKKPKICEIKKYNLLRIDSKFITVPAFEEIVNSHNLKSSIEFENSDWEILKQFVKADLGIAIISNICLSNNNDNDNDLISLPLEEYFPRMSYKILFKKSFYNQNKIENFLQFIKKYAQGN